MNPKNTPDGYYKWVAAGVIWLIAALNYADRMTIFSVFPVLKHELGFSDITLALLGSTFLWTYAFCSPIGGYLGDRFSRRGIILTSLVLFSLVTFATGLVHSQVQLIGLRCLLGLSEAIFLPPALAYVAGFHSGEDVVTGEQHMPDRADGGCRLRKLVWRLHDRALLMARRILRPWGGRRDHGGRRDDCFEKRA